ncbi:PLP-dependent aminotransferase family protein [Aromatoleum diolicum]|uniref:Aminotransferase class I/II-fold pyridoxal phosphate-dependent enzyme n=1 Tax=Aromatoleum diolicum TaxID=75796 RepID=A0ABX1QB35_9RHOO|nr:PLP-dependent aminotransferase family protein [Aromatoleum diolicum]NMG74399.1 aminotransferase class I/II-fold pyridoxal phosphate-dependent enzyme [Aromatoleum diolicum]
MEQRALRYEQLADELAGLIAERILRPGDRLPSVRTMAREKKLSVSTVVQALRQLEERGQVEARPQSGFFVRPLTASRNAQLEPQARQRRSRPVAVDISSRLMGVVALNSRPDMVPLGPAMPAAELLPIAPLQRLYGQVGRQSARLLDAASHSQLNHPDLVRQFVRHSLTWGQALAADEIVVTNSCTEALLLCLRAVTRPGDTVAVESPSYYLMLQLLEELGLKALEIPTHPRHGLSVDALEIASRERRIAACLLVSNFNNPLGSLVPDEEKRRLATLTAERGIPVIEDDIFGDLHYGPHRPWPLKSFDTAGNVMLCSSLSKTLSPSLRLGYVAAGRYHADVVMQKTLTSGATNPVTQAVAARYLESTAYDRHLRGLRRVYEKQVMQMSEAVLRHFPAGTRLSQPQGGFVLWVELPAGGDGTALFEEAAKASIAIVPGDLFSASGHFRNCLRLNCGNPWSPRFEDAIRRLGAFAAAQCAAGRRADEPKA